jgi:hypothetical protein
MKAVEYSDLYKFAASLGGALLAIWAGLPWLMLREEFGLDISEQQLAELTKVAQEVMADRQRAAAGFIAALPWITAGFAVLGLALLLPAVWFWWNRTQRPLDIERELMLAKLRKELGGFVEESLLRELESLVSGLIEDLRQLEARQVKRFLQFARLEESGISYQVPKSTTDPDRRNTIHEDLRQLRESFLVRAFDPEEKQFSGRFRYPRTVTLRGWSRGLAAEVRKQRVTQLITRDGRNWQDIYRELQPVDTAEIKCDLDDAFEEVPVGERGAA